MTKIKKPRTSLTIGNGRANSRRPGVSVCSPVARRNRLPPPGLRPVITTGAEIMDQFFTGT